MSHHDRSNASPGRWKTGLALALALTAGLGAAACSSTPSTSSTQTKAKANVPATYAPLPEPVASFGAAASDGWLYVYGGHRAQIHTYHTQAVSSSLYRLNLSKGGAWEKLPDGPAVQGMNLVSHKGMIYRLGGMQPRNSEGEKTVNISLDDASRFNTKTGKWESLPDMPEPRSSYDVAFIGETLYVVGGWDMRGEKGDYWHPAGLKLDLNRSPLQWEKFEQPFVRRALIVAVHEGKLYAIGGMDAEDEIYLRVDIYDPATNTWALGPELPAPRLNGFSPAAVVHDGELYVSVMDGSLLRLSDKGDAWEKVATTTPRIVHRMVSHGDRVVIVGGATPRGRAMLGDIQTVTFPADGSAPVVTPAPQAQPASAKGHHHHHHGAAERSAPRRQKAEPAPQAAPQTQPAPQASVTPSPAQAVAVQAVCPVMTDAPVGSKDDILVQYKGVAVRLCCEGCLAKWTRDADAYAMVRFLPQLAGLDVPSRELEQTFCPVNRTRVVSSHDPFVMYQGKKVYLYNNAAVRKWNADPQKYAHAELLPQLAQN